MQDCRFPSKLLNGTKILTHIIIAILSPKTDDCTTTKVRIVNTLKQDDSRSDCCAKSRDYEGNSGELSYPIDFLNSMSLSGFPPHKSNWKLTLLSYHLFFSIWKLQQEKFPNKIAFNVPINKAQRHALQRVGLYLPSPLFSHGQPALCDSFPSLFIWQHWFCQLLQAIDNIYKVIYCVQN